MRHPPLRVVCAACVCVLRACCGLGGCGVRQAPPPHRPVALPGTCILTHRASVSPAGVAWPVHAGVRHRFVQALVRYLPARGFRLNGLLDRVSTQLERDTRFTHGQAVLTELIPHRDSLAL